jgi:iron complex transport system ATP-binding protein
MLEARKLSIVRGGRTLLDRVSLALGTAAVTAAVGPNGAGKSTLVKALAGELRPACGEVLLDGLPLARYGAAGLAARRAVLSQASGLAFPFTVLEVVRLAFSSGVQGPRALRDAAAAAALAEVGLNGFAPRLYQQLSGGEQQRVQLARVLCQVSAGASGSSRFLLLDEPTSSLDIAHQLGLAQLLKRRAPQGLGVLVVLHDLNLASFVADRLVMMRDGRIVADGPPAEVVTAETIEAVYGLPLKLFHAAGSDPPYVLPQAVGAG